MSGIEPVVYREDVFQPYPEDIPFPLGEREIVDTRSESFLAADAFSMLDIPDLSSIPAYKYHGLYRSTRSVNGLAVNATILDQSKCHRRDTRTIADPYGCGHCVGYGGKHFLLNYPITNPSWDFSGSDLYFFAQDHDEWTYAKNQHGQEPYNGSSLNGLMKAFRSLGFINEWVWCKTPEDVYRWLVRGPVIMATSWFREMFFPQRHNGYLKPEGQHDGGHLYVIDGYNLPMKRFRVLNSWGRAWNKTGRAWIHEDGLRFLMNERAYPAASPVEVFRA